MWRETYLDTRVLSADPLELVHILYEHTLAMVADARQYLAEGNIAARGHAISRAIAAIEELDRSLNRETGADIAQNLAALYHYMQSRLVTANIRQEDTILEEVESLLKTLDEAWRAIRPNAPAETYQTAAGHGQFGGFAAEQHAEFAGQGWSA